MKKTLMKAFLTLALSALFVPAVGCKELLDYGIVGDGSFSEFVFGIDVFPVDGGSAYFEEFEYFEDDYDDGYFEDDYFEDDYYDDGYDDDFWKRKRADH